MKGEQLSFTLFYTFITFFMLLGSTTAADTITLDRPLVDGMTLVSKGQIFELGFFSPGDSKSRYLGVWYKNFPNISVWVANRKMPIKDRNGVLSIGIDGNLILLNGTKGIIWSSVSSGSAENPIAQLLESGNFVVRDAGDENPENYMWESFDYPCDTQIQGMKLGWSRKTGKDWYLTSWRNSSDPSPGDFTLKTDMDALPQVVLRKGLEKIYRTGPWNGVGFGGASRLRTRVLNGTSVNDEDDSYYLYEFIGNSTLTRLRLTEQGSIERFVLNEGSTDWILMFKLEIDLCDNYRHCGANGYCRIGTQICDCLAGFVPKSQNEWELLNWTSGCIRRTPLDCPNGEGFIEVASVKLPDLLHFWLDRKMTLKECRAECLKKCSCIAYANSYITQGGSGCIIWFGDLIDVREFSTEEESKQTIYIRVPASELDSRQHSSKKRKLSAIVVLLSIASAVLIFGLVLCIIWKRRWNKRGSEMKNDDFELPLFSLATVASATDDFSDANMIGKGGFGPVYKGTLGRIAQEIAVKRLSNNSGQGLQEFKNEVILISKLQHRNLVKLLGCCIEREERMLIYEYMPNSSLDSFVFDERRRLLLPWQKRLDIILGIARGLLYLHQDSRLRIIHRDLKTSNILLDCELNPKISDFGIAKIIGGDQIEAKTKHIIGTHGYMSPEYVVDGKFSVKSDVFSLGVLLLEIVSGKKNRGFCHPDHYHNLLGHIWLLWNENRALELMDASLADSYVESQVLRCIQVGLLCIQKLPKDRPSMSSVVLMLVNEEKTLPQPKQPGFFIERGPDRNEEHYTENTVTMTTQEGR